MHCSRAILDLVNARWNSRWGLQCQSQVFVDHDLAVILRQTQESFNVAEFVLVDDRVLAKVDVVHRLGKVDERPAGQTDVLRRLQLVV